VKLFGLQFVLNALLKEKREKGKTQTGIFSSPSAIFVSGEREREGGGRREGGECN